MKKFEGSTSLTYITSRGKWYEYSWKGDLEKSGGVEINIGIHFFDMLLWIFGGVKHSEVHIAEDRKKAGYMELEKAIVKWLLLLDKDDLPKEAGDKPTYRSITVDGKGIEFSGGFTDLHTVTYQNILDGNGYGIENVNPVINLLYDISNSNSIGIHKNRSHRLIL